MSDRAAELTEQLNRAPRDLSHPILRPRDAATLILVDRSESIPKVLMGRRHHGHKFMPGKFVFPGGRVEPGDRRAQSVNSLAAAMEVQLMKRVNRPSASKARGYALAAVRETYEETGILMGIEGAQSKAEGAWSAFAASGIQPDLAAIHFVGRAITPPGRPLRFDARFFAADASAIAARVEGVVGPQAELVELVWLPIGEARRLEMQAITITMLAELEERIGRGMPSDMPAPFYRWRGNRFVREIL